ncbi:MAG: hypothetical protein ACI9DG_002213 [Oleispira sp.]|jgi:uncharacterized protein (DUF1501 family)
MKRRDFIQMLAATGMTASLPLTAFKAHAAAPDHFLVIVNAGGGWDPTSLCDPKGNLSQYLAERPDARNEGSINSIAINTETKRNPVSGMAWSDTPRINNNDATTARVDTQFQNFFTTYHDKLTVINGVDNGTNNHSSGNRATWSGNLEMGYPSLAALFAASKNPGLPMAYISNGGYDFTASLVSRARASSAGFIDRLADPNSDRYHYRNEDQSTDVYSQIKQAQSKRLARQKANETLPLRRQQLNQLFTVRQADNDLAKLSEEKAIIEALKPTNDHMNNRDQGFKRQASLVAAAFKSGVAASANISTGGFDTHGNHDNSQYQSLGDLLEGVAYLQEALEAAGIADKTTVVIGSDFGRTPYYNSGSGKDHWPVTSVMVMHPTGSGKGGNVFGASTDKFRAQTLSRTTGQPDVNGQLLTPAHVNLALRKELGIHDNTLAVRFPLNVDDFEIFS